MRHIELPESPLRGSREFFSRLDQHGIVNGVSAWLMACTGPFVVMLDVAVSSDVSSEQLSSWVLAAFGFGGLLSIVCSLVYRMPLGLAWTIPGSILLGGALEHLPYEQCIGAFVVTGGVITVLGVTGWVGKIAALIPLNVVMGMVAGVFLPFVLKVISAFEFDAILAATVVFTFVAVSAVPRVARIVPPIVACALVGLVVLGLTHPSTLSTLPSLGVATPVFVGPVFTWAATAELVLPLTVTVIGIHNLQGFAVSQANGYTPPRNTLTTLCGIGSFAYAALGAVPTCVTGPANALLNASGEKRNRYVGGVVFGALMLVFGVFAPLTTAVALSLPLAFIGLVGGLAMFDVLRSAFLTAFSGRLSIGALTAFIVTVADQPILNIGAPFWAVVFGVGLAYLFERRDLKDD